MSTPLMQKTCPPEPARTRAGTSSKSRTPAVTDWSDTVAPASTRDTGPAAAPVSLSDKLQRGDLMAAACPSRVVLRHLTSQWGVLVVIALLPGTRRFNELRRGIGGISERMLAQTLQWLEADGIVERKAYQVVPPHVEYRLTPLGREAAIHVQALADWVEINLGRIRPDAARD